MIGQVKTLQIIDKLIENDFPRFVIITGRKGHGKKNIAHYISSKLNYPLVECGIRIDELRKVIELSYKHTEPIIYEIADADKMSIGAKNSLLKVIEEPPNNAYFIMTLQTIENTLPTIKSRCQEIKMQNYTEDNLLEFMKEINPNLSQLDKTILLDICDNRYEIELVNNYGVQDFYKFVQKVVDNIYKVQSANSFKLEENLNLKDDIEKYDLNLFLKTYKSVCINNAISIINQDNNSEELSCYIQSVYETSNTINQLNVTGISKQSLIDVWILNIRKIWRN